MRINKMRDKEGKKWESATLRGIAFSLKRDLNHAGFITDVYVVNGTSIHIGMHMCSFRICTTKLGYNARINHFSITRTKKGYVRTSTPTWGQREQFNHIVNNRLDGLGVKANIKSGDYTIRSYDNGRVNEWNFPDVQHGAYGLMVPSVLEIVRLPQAELAVEWHGINAPWIAVGE